MSYAVWMRASAIAVALFFCACARPPAPAPAPAPAVDVDPIAREYVSLVLAAGRHDSSYVDAYFGPPELERAVDRAPLTPPAEIARRAHRLAARLQRADDTPRRAFLLSQLSSVEAFAHHLDGARLPLATEARRLFGIDAPRPTREQLEAAVRAAERALPGEGSLAERVARFRAEHEIPPDRVEAVAGLCIEESRERTRRLVELPDRERVELSLVHGAPWEAYLWYLGDYRSRIELDASRSIQLDDVCRLMSHEGYPGHHTYSVLLDQRLVRQRGRVELSVYPLYSPLSVLMEGTAENATSIVFPGDQWRSFLEERIAPASGLEQIDISRTLRVARAIEGLRPALAEAAYRYFDEGADLDQVAEFLERYGAIPRAEARRMFAGADRRSPVSYLFTYPVGRRLVASFLGDGPDRAARFFQLLLSPRPPSALER